MALLLTAGVFSASPLAASLPRFSFSRSENLGERHAPLALPSLCVALASPLNSLPAGQTVYCGRGDKKTARGKRFKHSFGNARPRNKKKGRGPPPVPAPPAPPRKDKFDDGDIVKIVIDESLFS